MTGETGCSAIDGRLDGLEVLFLGVWLVGVVLWLVGWTGAGVGVVLAFAVVLGSVAMLLSAFLAPSFFVETTRTSVTPNCSFPPTSYQDSSTELSTSTTLLDEISCLEVNPPKTLQNEVALFVSSFAPILSTSFPFSLTRMVKADAPFCQAAGLK